MGSALKALVAEGGRGMMHKAKPAMAKRKDDLSCNADGLEKLIHQQREKEKTMYKVRINKSTILLKVKR